MNRRKFIQGIAVTTIATLASSAVSARESSAKLKIVVFWEDGFPYIDGLNLTKTELQTALKDHDTIFADLTSLAGQLTANTDVFVMPYGSAFPKKGWNTIFKYLQNGGNLLNLGGVPFSAPVQSNKAEIRQVNYHKRLGITQSFPIDGKDVESWSDASFGSVSADSFTVNEIYEFYLKLSNVNDFPDEAGSDGRREAKVEALIFGLDKNKRRIAAPVIQINRLQGEFAGGSWVLANFSGAIDADLIKSLAERAAFGAFEIVLSPSFSTYKPDERPRLLLRTYNPNSTKNQFTFRRDRIVIKTPKSRQVGIDTSGDLISLENRIIEYPERDDINFVKLNEPGYYTANYRIEIINKKGLRQTLELTTGFWVRDEKLLSTGEPFTADRHFLYRNNQPFPVAGTTYMSSDVARRFLLEPNPAVWDKDFAEMKSAGVNMIRTGIWTAWSLYTDEKGEVKEEVLRAFEAFMLTAKKHDIPIIFTFFAFMPEFFGGKNAYLDPVSIAGQKKFLSAFASRMKGAHDIIWDLINEPSFANPKNLWSCRPNYDEFEKSAWLDSLKKRFNQFDESKLGDILRNKWRLREDENPFELPTMEDFDNYNIAVKRRPLKALEFRLFAQEVFRKWASSMSEELKKAGNSVQMVTVGQDEAGTGDSPTPQLHSDVLDFTCLHNWWANDELLWDGVMTKSPEKPNLVGETGLMFYEGQDGAAWRDQQTDANLLERKMALSLGANGCGFIQWIWNINPFMDNENEAAIGFYRVDGTAKPELESFVRIAKFADENRSLFAGKKDEKVLLVIPHSYQFLPRNYAQEATRKAVRVLHYQCFQPARAVSEYNLQSILKEETPPKLIVVPSVNSFNQSAWEQLLKLVEKGSTLAISGYFNDDEHLIPQTRYNDFGSETYPPVPVAPNESFDNYFTHFGNEKIQQVRKAGDNRNSRSMHNFLYKGRDVLWTPVPLEVGENLDAIRKFYDYALTKAEIMPQFALDDYFQGAVLVRPTEFEKSILYLVMNESSGEVNFELTHLPSKTAIEVRLQPGQTDLIFVETATGRILGRLR